jgi:putative oxidoreductase
MSEAAAPSPAHASLPVRAYLLLIALGRWFAPLLLLAIRVTWGWQLFLTGKGKLGNLDKVTGFFSQLNIPMPHFNAVLVACTECFGGLLLLAGLGGRLAAVPLTISMTVAYLTAHKDNIHSLDDFVHQDPFPFLFTTLVIFAFGPGLLSIDGLLKYTIFAKHIQQRQLPVP